MKVICIKEPNLNILTVMAILFKAQSIIQVGSPYTVCDTVKDNDGEFYELSEHKGFLYAIELFSEVSKIDETEMERNYNKSVVMVG